MCKSTGNPGFSWILTHQRKSQLVKIILQLANLNSMIIVFRVGIKNLQLRDLFPFVDRGALNLSHLHGKFLLRNGCTNSCNVVGMMPISVLLIEFRFCIYLYLYIYILYYTAILYYIIFYYIIFYFIVLYYIYYIILYFIISYYIILYYIILCLLICDYKNISDIDNLANMTVSFNHPESCRILTNSIKRFHWPSLTNLREPPSLSCLIPV